MTYNVLIVFISLILENLVNLYIPNEFYMLPLFTPLSLIFIYPYFKNSKKDYLLFSSIVGFIYDIVFTNFYILNAILFFIIAYIIYNYLKKLNFNFINIILLSIIIILFYNIILFLIFNITNYYDYDILDLIYIIKHVFIINLIYIFSLYFISCKKFLKNIL